MRPLEILRTNTAANRNDGKGRTLRSDDGSVMKPQLVVDSTASTTGTTAPMSYFHRFLAMNQRWRMNTKKKDNSNSTNAQATAHDTNNTKGKFLALPFTSHQQRKHTYSMSLSSVVSKDDELNSAIRDGGNGASTATTRIKSNHPIRVRKLAIEEYNDENLRPNSSSDRSSTWEDYHAEQHAAAQELLEENPARERSHSGASMIRLLIIQQHDERKRKQQEAQQQQQLVSDTTDQQQLDSSESTSNQNQSLSHGEEEILFSNDNSNSSYDPPTSSQNDDAPPFRVLSTSKMNRSKGSFRNILSPRILVTPANANAIDDDDDDTPLLLRQKPMNRQRLLLRQQQSALHPMLYTQNNHILVNYEREKRGLPLLRRNRYMDDLAREHAEKMAQQQQLFHSVTSLGELQTLLLPLPSTFANSETTAGTSHEQQQQLQQVADDRSNFHVAENVLRGESVRVMHDETMLHTNHTDRRNILSKTFTEFGMGTAIVYDTKSSGSDRNDSEEGPTPLLYMVQLFRSTPPPLTAPVS